MEIIDTNSITDEELEKLIDQKQQELFNKGYYDEHDFALVRTTDNLEKSHTLTPWCKRPLLLRNQGVAYLALFNILREQNNVNVYNDDEYDKLEALVKENCPVTTQYRSTLHFTLNGLVASHDNGNFDNRDFIIIDKLSKHLGKENFISFRMEDTFLQGDFNISDEAVILINEEKYPQLKEKYPWLDSYNVVLFRGDEKKAVKIELLKMGIIPEEILTNYAKNTERTELYGQYLASIDSEGLRHNQTQVYKDDDNKSIILWNLFDKMFYEELFNYFGINDEEKNKLLSFLLDNHISDYKKAELFQEFIKNTVVDNYCKFVQEYNQKYIDMYNNGLFPSNDEILGNPGLIIDAKNKKR